MEIDGARAGEVEALLPLMRGYCDFYDASPPDEGLRRMARELIAAPDGDGMLLVARAGDGRLVGFAAVGWKWSSLRAARVAIMEDLFVHPDARGSGAGIGLVRECARRAKRHGAPCLGWTTALDNRRAQAVYDRVGGRGEPWLEYELDLG